jgi:ectoine hydroxylase-related dioxygenase (phytanoyl-CoA dioxygenase family)
MPPGTELELVPIEVPAGGAAFHDGWTFHGSPPNDRPDRERRSVVSHMISTDTRWDPVGRHPVYSKYRRPGELELDEAFFPIMWREDGHRTAWIDAMAGADPALRA